MKFTIFITCVILLCTIKPCKATESLSHAMQCSLKKTDSSIFRNQAMQSEDSDEWETLLKLSSAYTDKGMNEEAIKYAEKMLELDDTTEIRKIQSLSYLGQTYLLSDRYPDAIRCFSQGLSILSRLEQGNENDGSHNYDMPDSRLIVPILGMYNGLGVCAVNYEMDYVKASRYFYEGLQYARRISEGNEYAVIAYNLVFSYFIREDPGGLEYAEEIYQTGKNTGDNQVRHIGAYGLAMMHYLKKDYPMAEACILEAINDTLKTDLMGTYNLYANILRAEGRMEEADINYRIAIANPDNRTSTSLLYVYLSYGEYLMEIHNYDEAVLMLKKGLDIANLRHNKVFTYRLHRALSDAYAAQGEWKASLMAYRKYHEEADSIFSIRSQRAYNEMTLKYEKARHDAEIQKKNAELMKQRRFLYILLSLSVMVLSITLIIFLLYRHKNRMYMQVVRQYRDNVLKEKSMQQEIERLKQENASSVSDLRTANRTLDSEKSDCIFRKLEELMQEKHVYCDTGLSRDSIAEQTGTNRTYLSQIIREHTGKSFSQYINGYRVNHALYLLSDSTVDLPMKAVEFNSGFGSSSAFFNLFREQVGMSPAKYREKIIMLSKKDKLSN